MFWVAIGLMLLLALAFVLLPIINPNMNLKTFMVVALAILVPFSAILIYQKIGHPDAASQVVQINAASSQRDMPPNHAANSGMNMDLEKLAAQLASKLEKNPNPEGWALLARTYVQIKRYKEAVDAFEKASDLVKKDPNLLADYADALGMSNGGALDLKTEQLVDQALAIDPSHKKGLMLKATIEFNRKDFKQAIVYWEKLLKLPDLDAETTKVVKGSIEEANRLISNPN